MEAKNAFNERIFAKSTKENYLKRNEIKYEIIDLWTENNKI